MGINRDKPDLWKNDIVCSVDLYNKWFMEFAPKAFRDSRVATTKDVENALIETHSLQNISPELLEAHPEVLPMLRMSTCPPIARDRLVGLSGVKKSLVENMEDKDDPHISKRMKKEELYESLTKIASIIKKMADPDIFMWLSENREPEDKEIERAATIVADRLCGAVADPIIRNAQEARQLKKIEDYLKGRKYKFAKEGTSYNEMEPGTFSFHTNVPAFVNATHDAEEKVNITVDVAIQPHSAKLGDLPLLMEAKSAGDFTNVNKRRKEEGTKMSQLRETYGDNVSYTLFLCGYFDSGYLGYEAAEGIDWIWEHRMSDMEKMGI
jgi:hypothetical protein